MDLPPRGSTESREEADCTLLDHLEKSRENSVCLNCSHRRGPQPLCQKVSLWILCFVSIIANLYLSMALIQTSKQNGYWRASDFSKHLHWLSRRIALNSKVTSRKEIPAASKSVRFTATLKFNESHELYRPVTDPAYVGNPNPQIDEAWDNLMGGD